MKLRSQITVFENCNHCIVIHTTTTLTFSGFSVGFCINEEKDYLLPTWARKITCWHLALMMTGPGAFSWNVVKLFSQLKLVTDNLLCTSIFNRVIPCQTLWKSQVSSKSVRVRVFFRVGLTWNDTVWMYLYIAMHSSHSWRALVFTEICEWLCITSIHAQNYICPELCLYMYIPS